MTRLGPAAVRYNDFKGTVALDGQGGALEDFIYDAAGLNHEEWTVVGFEVGASEGGFYGRVFAVPTTEVALVGGIPGLGDGNGVIPVSAHDMLDEQAEAFLSKFKRWNVIATYKGRVLKD